MLLPGGRYHLAIASIESDVEIYLLITLFNTRIVNLVLG